jgi:hypothetical protein
MEAKEQFLIETDIIVEHLTYDETAGRSVLEYLMEKGECFTTVINSAELFFNVSDNMDRDNVMNAIKALKVLGLNSRYSLNISDFFNKVASVRDALMCSVAKNNDLPIVTIKPEKYEHSGIQIIDARRLKK